MTDASTSDRTIAALYVAKNGCYFGLGGVDPWDEARDARLYNGPHPIVAHPPCERWGQYWGGSPTQFPRLIRGDDKGCFEAALASVRKYGGVLDMARKATWLYACHTDLPPLRWGRAPGDFVRIDDGYHTAEERGRAVKTGACQLLSKRQRAATPIEFRDLLISIARSAYDHRETRC